MRGQLFICELLKEIQRFLARCSQIRYKRLHTVVVVSIDVGLITLVCQSQPFLSAPVYPGFGTRPLEPHAQQERWYQHFHLLPQADQLIGHDQETVRLYLSYFYTHWLGNKQALRPKEFEEIVKTYAQPEAARGSIAWYRAGGGSGQVALASGNTPPVPIAHPTMILWGEADPIAPPAWADRLGDTFSHLLGVQFLPAIGHFVPFEAPEAVVEAIRTVL